MKILVIGPIPQEYGGKSFGGIATHIKGLSSTLTKQGHNVSLWYHKLNKGNTINNTQVLKNTILSYFTSLLYSIPFILNNEYNYLTLKQRFLLTFQVHRLKKILNENFYDIIHIHSLHNTSAIALQQLNNNNITYIITDHGFWQDANATKKGSPSFIKLKKVILGCSTLIYISDYAKEKHLSTNFGQIDKLFKIKNPIIFDDFYGVHKSKEKKKLIFFNGLTESLKIKRLDVLLNAVEKDPFLKNNVKLIVLANQEGHEYVKSNTFSFEIELLKSMNWESVKKLYQRSDIFVLPSKSESFGLVYLEALSFGLPIIGIEDMLIEFQSNFEEYIGEPFDPNKESSKDLAVKIKKVLKANLEVFNISKALKKNYSWENNINNYIDVYKQIKD